MCSQSPVSLPAGFTYRHPCLCIASFATTVLMCLCSIHRTGLTERKNPPSLAKKTADPYTLPRTRGGEGKWAADFSNFAEKAPPCRERPASTLRTDSSDGSDQAIAPRPGNAPTGRTTNLSRLGRLACAVFAANQQETEYKPTLFAAFVRHRPGPAACVSSPNRARAFLLA
jgi:hypothetical protein